MWYGGGSGSRGAHVCKTTSTQAIAGPAQLARLMPGKHPITSIQGRMGPSDHTRISEKVLFINLLLYLQFMSNKTVHML